MNSSTVKNVDIITVFMYGIRCARKFKIVTWPVLSDTSLCCELSGAVKLLTGEWRLLRQWSLLLRSLLKSCRSASCNSWSKVSRSGGLKRHRLLRRRHVLTRWRSAAAMKLLHAVEAYSCLLYTSDAADE